MSKKNWTAKQLERLSLRKPARRLADVPADVREGLALGLLSTANLTEWLSVDRPRLATTVLSQLLDAAHWKRLSHELQLLPELSALKYSQRLGELLACELHPKSEAWKQMAQHSSDVIREWAACCVGYRADIRLSQKMRWIRPMADDLNAGLREIAWISLRNDIAQDPRESVLALIPWTQEKSERLRRFASEVTRPCGVWCNHIAAFKQQPELGLPILEPLRSDSAKYVRDSVGNWLNDASKTKPEFVLRIAEQWLRESPTKQTEAIVRRGLRTLRKKSIQT